MLKRQRPQPANQMGRGLKLNLLRIQTEASISESQQFSDRLATRS